MTAITVTIKLFVIAMVTFSTVYVFLEKDALNKSWTILKARTKEIFNLALDCFDITHHAITYITKTFGQIIYLSTKAGLQIFQFTMSKAYTLTQSHIAEVQTPIRIQTRKIKMNMNLLAKKYSQQKSKFSNIEKENILLTSKNAELKQELQGMYDVWTKTMAQLELTEKKYKNLMIYSNAITTALRKSLIQNHQKTKQVTFNLPSDSIRGFKNENDVNTYVKGLINHDLINRDELTPYSNNAESQSTATK